MRSAYDASTAHALAKAIRPSIVVIDITADSTGPLLAGLDDEQDLSGVPVIMVRVHGSRVRVFSGEAPTPLSLEGFAEHLLTL
jgi:hypothetical protein